MVPITAAASCRRLIVRNGALLVLAVGLHAASMAAGAQTPGTFQPPRTPDGHPDFQGVWLNPVAMVPLEKSAASGEALVVSAGRARTMADASTAQVRTAAPLQVDAPEHSDPLVVRGENRTRQIVEPPDGKLPYLPAAQKAVDEWFSKYSRARAGLVADNPEDLPLQDRCITHQGQPPMPFATVYGHVRQIVQTPGYVLIDSEVGSELRIIRIGGPHAPAALRSLWGDSVGHWEGDILVIETVNFRLDYPFHVPTNQKPVMVGPASIMEERFTRVSATELDYA